MNIASLSERGAYLPNDREYNRAEYPTLRVRRSKRPSIFCSCLILNWIRHSEASTRKIYRAAVPTKSGRPSAKSIMNIFSIFSSWYCISIIFNVRDEHADKICTVDRPAVRLQVCTLRPVSSNPADESPSIRNRCTDKPFPAGSYYFYIVIVQRERVRIREYKNLRLSRVMARCNVRNGRRAPLCAGGVFSRPASEYRTIQSCPLKY